MSRDDTILDRLPHRPPFRFVTAFTALQPGVMGSGEWAIRGDEEFFRGHFPDSPIVPGVLLAESLAQLAGLTRFSGQPPADGIVRLAHVDIKFGATVIPPAVVSLHARLVRTMTTLLLFEVQALCGGTSVASGMLTLSEGQKHGKEVTTS